MINSFQLLKQFDEQISSNELTHIQKNVLLNKYIELLLAQLQVGDSIEGLVSKLPDNKYVLQVKPNMNIPIHMLEQLETGKLMSFIVQGKEEGKLYLQQALSLEGRETSVIQKTLEELNLPKTGPMQDVIDNFLQKHLSLTKETLLKAYQMNQAYDIPAKVITSLIEHQELFSLEEAKTFPVLRLDGVSKGIADIKTVLQGLESKEELINIFNILKERITSEKLNTLVNNVITESAERTSSHINQQIMIRDKEQLQDANTINGTKATNEANNPNQNLFTADALNKLVMQVTNNDYTNINGGILKRLISLIYDEALHVNIQNIKNDQGESEKIYNTYNLLTKVLKSLEQASLSKEEKESINYIKEPLSLLGKLNIQAEYFIFPMLHENKQTQGELYFFKPKKTNKKNKDNMYIVLTLNLPRIDNIEIHINKQQKNILLHINVEDESVKKHISQHIPLLNEQIQGLGFEISKMTWGLLKDSKRVQLNAQEHSDYSLNHMDFKI